MSPISDRARAGGSDYITLQQRNEQCFCGAKVLSRACLLWVIPRSRRLDPYVSFHQLRTCPSIGRGPGSVTSGLVQVQQTEQAYSITSSAVASSGAGTVRPSIFAILRLITS